MTKKQKAPTAGMKKAQRKVSALESSAPKKVGSIGDTQVASTNPMAGTVNEYKQFVRSKKFRPTVEGTSDTTGEIRGFKVPGNKNKNLNKNVAKAESRGQAFIKASDQGKLFEGR